MFSSFKQISLALMLLVPVLAQASDRSSQQYKEQLAKELAAIDGITYIHAPNCTPKTTASKAKTKEKNWLFNNKVLASASLGLGAGSFFAYHFYATMTRAVDVAAVEHAFVGGNLYSQAALEGGKVGGIVLFGSLLGLGVGEITAENSNNCRSSQSIHSSAYESAIANAPWNKKS